MIKYITIIFQRHITIIFYEILKTLSTQNITLQDLQIPRKCLKDKLQHAIDQQPSAGSWNTKARRSYSSSDPATRSCFPIRLISAQPSQTSSLI